jgi:acetyl esterase/lipase
MDERSGLRYADRESGSLHLDLFLPDGDPPHPLVVLIHGGGWEAGDRTDVGDAPPLVDRGYAVASVDYRLTDAAAFPAQIRDCRAAVRWLRAHADDYGLDPDRVGAWGWSAGAHLAALLGTAAEASFDGDPFDGAGSDGEPTVHPERSHRVRAVADFFGPTDLLRMDEQGSDFEHSAPGSPESKLVGGPLAEHPGRAERANPIAHVDGDEPPFLVVHGSDDGVVPREQSDLLVSALGDADDAVTYHVVAGAGHGGFDDPAVPELVDGFFDRHLR